MIIIFIYFIFKIDYFNISHLNLFIFSMLLLQFNFVSSFNGIS